MAIEFTVMLYAEKALEGNHWEERSMARKQNCLLVCLGDIFIGRVNKVPGEGP